MILDLTRNFYTGHQKDEQQIKMNKVDCIKIKTCASKLPLVDSEKKLCVLVYPVISALGCAA